MSAPHPYTRRTPSPERGPGDEAPITWGHVLRFALAALLIGVALKLNMAAMVKPPQPCPAHSSPKSPG